MYFRYFSVTAGAFLLVAASIPLHAQTCTTQAEMSASERSVLMAASQRLSQSVTADNTQIIQAGIAPQAAPDASGILNAVSDVAPKVKGATFIVSNLYLLDATDLKPDAKNVRFYCGVFNSTLRTTITFGTLPPARYGLALIHATGVPHPQQIAAIFAETEGQWNLAGFSARPLTMDGHDSLWYWKQARAEATKNEKWNAYFYYTTARYLATPVDYLSSTNLDKLLHEQYSVQPAGVPGQQPMQLQVNGQILDVTQMETSDALGGLDLVIHYNSNGATNLAAMRQQNIAVMHAMLQAHPELRNAFHGLWVYAVVPEQAPFGIELPMKQIP